MALCAKCKNQIEVGDSYCKHCGRELSRSPVSPASHREKHAEEETSTLAILAIIFAFAFPIVGFILSFFALAQLKRHPELKGKGLAWSALLLPVIATVLFIILLIVKGH